MTQAECEQKKQECWEEFWRNGSGPINRCPETYEALESAFYDSFDRAYALGKIDGAKKQKERDDHYIKMQKAFARFDKACDRTIHALDKLTNTLDKL